MYEYIKKITDHKENYKLISFFYLVIFAFRNYLQKAFATNKLRMLTNNGHVCYTKEHYLF